MAVKVELTVENCPQREAFYDLRAAVPLAEHVASLFRTFFPAASLAAPSRQRSGADGAPGSGERNPNNFGRWVPMHSVTTTTRTTDDQRPTTRRCHRRCCLRSRSRTTDVAQVRRRRWVWWSG